MKKIALLISVLVSYNMTSFAQTPRTVRTKEKSAIHVPPQKVPESLKAIYSSFKSKTDLYNDTYGWAISLEESVAVPFTPKSDAHLSEVRVPVKYIAGDNQVNVSIYAGPGSVPLTLLV